MKQHMGHGATVEEAFEVAVPAKSHGTGIEKVVDRPRGMRAATFVESYEENTNGGWHAVPVAYVESRDYKIEHELQRQKAQVFLFVQST